MDYDYYLAVFETKNKAIFLYSTLENKGYENFQLVSTPCSLKAGCNYSIKFKNTIYIDVLVDESQQLKIGRFDVYSVSKKNGKLNYKKIYLY